MRFSDAARALQLRTAPWRAALGLVLALSGLVAALFALGAVAAAFTGRTLDSALEALAAPPAPGWVPLTLLAFGGVILGVAVAMPLLHGRGARALLGPGRRFAAGDFGRALGVTLALGLALFAASIAFGAHTRNAPLGLWALWLLPVVAATAVQVFAEELLFRGYLQTTLAARFASPLVWAGVPSAVFAALHVGNTAAAGAWAILLILPPTLLGLVCAHLTARTLHLGAATGLHLANNLLGLLVVSVPGPMGQLLLWHLPFDPEAPQDLAPHIALNVVFLLAAWAILLRLLPRRAFATDAERDYLSGQARGGRG